jgi:peroxiredoxin (alkyl hydroperoxide reductase subunit C)
LRSFQKRLSEFQARGIRVAGISVDSTEINRRQSQKLGYTFPLLSDRDAKVIRAYGVLHPRAGPKKADIARPAEFLVDSNGIVRWVNLTENIAVRARPEQVLRAFEQLEHAANAGTTRPLTTD